LEVEGWKVGGRCLPEWCLSVLRPNTDQVRPHPLFLSFSLWRRDAGAEVSALVGVSPLPSMASRLLPWQNVQGRVSPSEEGEQEGGATRRERSGRRRAQRLALLSRTRDQRTGLPHPLFLSFSLWRRDAGAEVSALVGVSPLPSMASWLCLRQNVQDRVSPSEEGEQEGGTTRRERSGPRRAQRLAVLCRTPNQRPGPSPSPLPVLLPPEKGRRGGGFCSGSRIASPRFVHSTGLFSPSITMDTNPDVHFDGPQWTRRAKRPDRREEVPLGCDSRSKRTRRTEKDLCPHLSGNRSRQTIPQSPNHPIPNPPVTRSPAAGRI
jgi:hypothetical protein